VVAVAVPFRSQTRFGRGASSLRCGVSAPSR